MILLPLKDTTAAMQKAPADLPLKVAPRDSAASESTAAPYVDATAAMRSWSATLPKRSTGTTTLAVLPSACNVLKASSSRSGFMFPDSSASTKTGSAPVYTIALVVAANVRDEVKTKSPGLTPKVKSPRCNAAVPEDSATACLRPQYSASSASKASTSGPSGAIQPDRMARTRACSSSSVTSGEDI